MSDLTREEIEQLMKPRYCACEKSYPAETISPGSGLGTWQYLCSNCGFPKKRGEEKNMEAVSQVAPEIKVKQVLKRDGRTLQPFDVSKIENAVRKAWLSCEPVADEDKLQSVVQLVADSLSARHLLMGIAPEKNPEIAEVEEIQDLVEVALMRVNTDVAKHYILYRQRRADVRHARKHPDSRAVADYIHAAKYARYRKEDRRREIYSETVARTEDMHLRRFAHILGLDSKIRRAFDLVRDQRLLPSMRSMQFGGLAIETIHNRIYNCSATHVDRLEAFSEAFFLLLCGCGVGYSVQFEHVDKLPEFKKIDESQVRHHTVADSIQGWADALKTLLYAYVDGVYIEFSYEKIIAGHPEGTELKISGGKAPGHLPLKRALEQVRSILDGAQGRRFRPAEAHRVMCIVADAVLSGGIRRSSLICLFSLEDSEMMYIKTGKWFDREPWLANANNSVVIKRDEVKKQQFKRIFKMTREFGEPGFIFAADKDAVFNPCSEIGLNCKLKIDYDVMKILRERSKRGKPMPDVKLGDVYTGFAFCNLVEINAAKLKSIDDFLEVAEAATLIGTLQAAYTEMPYLGWVSEVIAEREALLGIGMTGMMDSPSVALDAAYQRQVAEKTVEWNQEFAATIGIRPAARITTVKPSGTTSLELGCVGSGHHAHHARRYIRRVTANELEPVFQYFRSVNPHMCIKKPDGDWVIEFPVEAPEGAIVKEDLNAIQFLDMVKSTYLNWVVTGTARPESSPGYTHNVSNTAQVRPEEWESVSEYLWENRACFAGVSLISVSGDKDYAFAPNEAISTESDEVRWNQLLSHYRPVDYTGNIEEDDATNLTQEQACAGGACEVVRS